LVRERVKGSIDYRSRITTFEKRERKMRKAWLPEMASLLMVCAVLVGPAVAGSPLEEGEITGKIEKANDAFLRDYEKLDYKAQGKWEEWGKGLKSLGWVVVRGDSGEAKDYLLLVVDTRTEIEGNGAEKCQVMDLGVGTRIEVKYRMGWDALHAVYVKKLGE
jgi:hypothetical protein